MIWESVHIGKLVHTIVYIVVLKEVSVAYSIWYSKKILTWKVCMYIHNNMK